jgi:hypothetical protein
MMNHRFWLMLTGCRVFLLMLAATTAATSREVSGTPPELMLRLIDATTRAPLGNTAVHIQIYLHNPACSGAACFASALDVMSNADGIVRLPADGPEQRAYQMLKVAATHYVEQDVLLKALSVPPPVSVRLYHEAPDLRDLRLRLVDAVTHAPISGATVHLEANYPQVVCCCAPCPRFPPGAWDVTSGPEGEVAIPTSAGPSRADYLSLTVSVADYERLDLRGRALAVPQPMRVQLRHHAHIPSAPP